MEIKSSLENSVIVVSIQGMLDTNTIDEAQTFISKILEDESIANLVIDIQEVDYLSSIGLRLFLEVAKKLAGRNGGLKVCCVNELVGEIFKISGFDSILDIYETRADAINSIN